MSKDNIKIVFLVSFIAILGKSLWMGFDLPSCLGMGVCASLLFAYDWMNNKKEQEAMQQEVALVKKNQEELLKMIQQVKSAQNLQNMNVQGVKPTPQITMNHPFPVRI